MTGSLATDVSPVGPIELEPDAHGQAAPMLVESLIHTMIEDALLSNARAIETVTIAGEVKLEKARLAGESEGRINESLGLLNALALSLRTEDHDFR